MENYKQAACQTARLRHSAGNTGGRGVRGKSLPFRRRLAASPPRAPARSVQNEAAAR